MGGFPVPPNSHSTGSLSSVSPRILDRVGLAMPSWNSGGKGVQDLRWQPDGREAVGGEGDVQRHRRLDLHAVGRDRPRARGRDRRCDAPQPTLRLSRIMKLDEEVRGVGQVPVAARDETLDVGQDVIGETSIGVIVAAHPGCRGRRAADERSEPAHNCRSRSPMRSAAASEQARANARSLTIFSTVSSGYALKNTSDGT